MPLWTKWRSVINTRPRKKLCKARPAKPLFMCLASAHESVLAKLHVSLYQVIPLSINPGPRSGRKPPVHHQKFFGVVLSMVHFQPQMELDVLARNPSSLVLSGVCFSETNLCPLQENHVCLSKTSSVTTDFPKKPYVSTSFVFAIYCHYKFPN